MHQITKVRRNLGTRSYRRAADRKRAISMLKKHGWNYFVCFRDISGGEDSPYALQYGIADWLKPNQFYIDR